MCGLAGMAGNGVLAVDLTTYRDILYMSAMRGPHSTGLMTVNTNIKYQAQNPSLTKRLGPSHYFIMMDDAEKNGLLSNMTSNIFIGHCRWSTVGKTTVENAHPFDTGRFVSAHNGTLLDSWSYSKSDKTDSQLMFEKMEEEGVVNVLEHMNEKSAYAISMYDKQTNRLILARNALRPLYVGISEKRNVMYWASEYGILYCAATRNNVGIKIFALTPGEVYWVNTDKIKKGNQSPWGVTKLNPKPAETSSSSSRSSGKSFEFDMSWGDWGQDDDTLAIPGSAGKTPNPPWEDTDSKKTHVMTDAEYEAYELSKAARATIIPVAEAKKADPYFDLKVPPSKHKKPEKSSRRSLLDVVDTLLDPKVQTIDQLFEDIDAQKRFEEAEKAIEEAQGVTKSKPKVTGDEECCICQRKLVGKDFMEAEAVDIEGSFYYSCKMCNDELNQSRIARGR